MEYIACTGDILKDFPLGNKQAIKVVFGNFLCNL